MSAKIKTDLLLCRWIHSNEEDKDDLVVFRPQHFPLPPSRGRIAITLDKNDLVHVESPGPDDRGTKAPGHWKLQGKLLTIEAPGWSGTFEVENVDKNTLVIRRLRE